MIPGNNIIKYWSLYLFLQIGIFILLYMSSNQDGDANPLAFSGALYMGGAVFISISILTFIIQTLIKDKRIISFKGVVLLFPVVIFLHNLAFYFTTGDFLLTSIHTYIKRYGVKMVFDQFWYQEGMNFTVFFDLSYFSSIIVGLIISWVILLLNEKFFERDLK